MCFGINVLSCFRLRQHAYVSRGICAAASVRIAFVHTTTMFRSTLSKTVLNASPRASRAATRPVLARGYHEKVISHYEQPRNVRLDQPRLSYVFGLSDNSPAPLLQVGSLNKNDPMVGTGLVGAPA